MAIGNVTGKQVWNVIRMLKSVGFKAIAVVKYDKNGVRNVVGYFPGKACIVQVRVSEDEYFLRLDGQVRKEYASVEIIESFQPFGGATYDGVKLSNSFGAFSAYVTKQDITGVQKVLNNFMCEWAEKLEDSFQVDTFMFWTMRNYNCVRDGAFPRSVFIATNKRVLAKIPEEMFIRNDGIRVKLITS